MSAIGIRRLLGDPRMTRHYCDEYFLPETMEHLTALGPQDVVVIGGGGLFQEYFVPFWRPFLELAAARRIPFCIWGVGLCVAEKKPPASTLTLFREVARTSGLCIVRDAASRRMLGSADVAPPVPCPSIVPAQALQAAPERRGLLHAVHSDLVTPEDSDRVREIAKAFADDTGRSYRETDNRLPQGDAAALRANLAIYASADMVLSSRLHGCIVGLAMGCRVLAMSSDPKVEAFMELAGLGEWVCGTVDVQTIQRKLSMLEHQPPAEAFIAKAIEANHQVAEKVGRIIQGAQDLQGSLR